MPVVLYALRGQVAELVKYGTRPLQRIPVLPLRYLVRQAWRCGSTNLYLLPYTCTSTKSILIQILAYYKYTNLYVYYPPGILAGKPRAAVALTSTYYRILVLLPSVNHP